MKKKGVLKIVAGIFSVIVLIIICSGIYLKSFLPNIKVRDLKVEATKERVERGKYLANCVLVCVDCHSTRDWSKISGPIVPGTEGMGGEVFDQKEGLPGRYIATNITPYYLKDWSDGEIYRAITSGVGKRNNAIFPIMPYLSYGNLDDEDVFSVIAYVRSMPPVKNDVPASVSDFPLNFIVNTIPKEAHPSKRPSIADSIQYGKYITTAASCLDCHTPFEKGSPIMKKAYAGGREFPAESGKVLISPNITFDKNTGIGDWDKDMFISTFKSFDPAVHETAKVEKGDVNTVMPWTMYSRMDTTDLIAIYNYLKSLPPIENLVTKTKPQAK